MRTALVTGATSGIGHAFCRELAERGNNLVLVARHRARLENVSDELRARHSVNVEILAADLSKRTQLRRVADRVADREHPIDLLVNNAGLTTRKSLLKGDLADEEAMLDVLCRAVLVLSHAGALSMKERGRGHIINVSSVAGFLPTSTYGAATSSAGGMAPASPPAWSPPAYPTSSRTSWYCAVLVSWYSSTMTCRNRRW